MGANKKRTRRRAELDDRHYLALELLTTVPTPNLDDIARECNVNRRTLYRWRLRKDFNAALRKLGKHKASIQYRKARKKSVAITRVEDFEFIFRVNGLLR